MKILVLSGPNLNMLGHKVTTLADGTALAEGLTLTKLEKALATYGALRYEGLKLVFVQTNHEGQLVDMMQKAYLQYDAVMLNPSSFSSYSLALRDAVEWAGLPVVEVHLMDLNRCEEFRSHSLIAEVCKAQFMGKQLDSYKEALDYLLNKGG